MLISQVQKQSNELFTAYESLERIRRGAIGRTVPDPKTSRAAVESILEMEELNGRYRKLQFSLIGKTGIHNRIANFLTRNTGNIVNQTLTDIERLRIEYSNQTSRNARCGLLCPLAFCSEYSLPRLLGAPKIERVFTVTWCADFQQLSAENIDLGLLEIIGVTTDGLMRWWREGHPDPGKQESRVWNDLKTLALKLVYLFGEASSIHDDKTIVTKLERISAQLKQLALNLVRLVYLRHEHYNDILQLFELLVPAAYSFSIIINISHWDADSRQTLTFLETYLRTLELVRDSLVSSLAVADEIRPYEELDSKPLSSYTSQIDHLPSTVDLDQSADGLSCQQDAIRKLKDMGLTEIKVNLESGGRLGNGSFSHVLKYPAENGSEEYAVKFFKCMKGDLERTKTRLLREAGRWIKLSHKNINTLLGYCIHGDEKLPGLVSPLCERTLQDLLEKPAEQRDPMEKLTYLYEIAEALEHSHTAKGLAHGDLRPPNVLLAHDIFTTKLTVKLTDFGVSYPMDTFDGYHLTSMQHTNVLYLAPELVSRKKKKMPFTESLGRTSTDRPSVSFKGDIYAFGCCFLEVMYNKQPFYYADSIEEINKLKSEGKFPALQTDISPHHWKLLERLWDIKPGKRPPALDVKNQISVLKL